MTRPDFELVARTIKARLEENSDLDQVAQAAARMVGWDIAEAFRKNYPRFDKSLFCEAAGLM